jgi:hypothetical protein
LEQGGDAATRRVLVAAVRDGCAGGIHHRGGSVLVGKPWPRLIAPDCAASALISAKIVGAATPDADSNPAPCAVRRHAPGISRIALRLHA